MSEQTADIEVHISDNPAMPPLIGIAILESREWRKHMDAWRAWQTERMFYRYQMLCTPHPSALRRLI